MENPGPKHLACPGLSLSFVKFFVWILAVFLASASQADGDSRIDQAVQQIIHSEFDIDLGLAVFVEGEGPVYSRDSDRLFPAASSMKSFVALDFLARYPDRLNKVPLDLSSLLIFGRHPAFFGFSKEEMDVVRGRLTGKTYLELAQIMMGHTNDSNMVYNAACNVLMVELGGPRAIQTHLAQLDSAFSGLDFNRYMYQWNGDGDNRATPAALARLYSMLSRGDLPGLKDMQVSQLRSLLQREDRRFEKAGTLYPKPMARIHAGFDDRGDRDLVYAVMGELQNNSHLAPPDAFVLLLAVVDTLTAIVRETP